LTIPLLRHQLAALKARRDFTSFKFAVYRPYIHAPHLELIDRALMDVARYLETGGKQGIGKLRIELPPRHGKSVTTARLFVAWVLGRIPNLRVILASYGASLSEGHSRYVRNLIRDSAYQSIFPGVALSDDSTARDAWELAAPHSGGLIAVGVGGALTGKGGHLLISDDLVKGREEISSEGQREKLWRWYTDDYSTRAEPSAAQIAIGTRWDVDDPLGRLDLHEPGQWRVIRLPALAEDNDPLGREYGEALWPERFSAEDLQAARTRMGVWSFSALYQQSPVPADGGIFQRDKFQVIDNPPSNIKHKVRFWDLALSEKTSADYTVGVLMGETADGRLIVLDVARFQVNWGDVTDRIAEVAQLDGPGVRIGVETAYFHTQAVKQLLNRRDLHGYSIKGYRPHTDKVTRALPFSARVDAQMVYVLRHAWLEDYLSELCSFPSGKHDDMVDASSSAYLMLERKPLVAHVRRYTHSNPDRPEDETGRVIAVAKRRKMGRNEEIQRAIERVHALRHPKPETMIQ